jgi:hypothetical protein
LFESADSERYSEEDDTTKFTEETKLKHNRVSNFVVKGEHNRRRFTLTRDKLRRRRWTLLTLGNEVYLLFPLGICLNQTTVAANGGSDSGLFFANNGGARVKLRGDRRLRKQFHNTATSDSTEHSDSNPTEHSDSNPTEHSDLRLDRTQPTSDSAYTAYSTP